MIGDVFPIPRQRARQHRPGRPLPRGAGADPPRPARPGRGRGVRDDVDGLRRGLRPVPGSAAAARRRRLRRADLRRLEAAAAPTAAFRRPQQARCRHLLGRRVPGPDARPTCCWSACWPLPALDVFGVGDDDQTIYGHAGADPALPRRLHRCFPGAGRPRARRSTTAARRRSSTAPARCSATTAVRVRQGDPRRDRRRPDAGRPAHRDRTAPHDAAPPPGRDHGAWLAESRRRAERDRRARPGQLAAARAADRALVRPGVPMRTSVRPDVLERTGVAAALAWIRVAVDPANLSARTST